MHLQEIGRRDVVSSCSEAEDESSDFPSDYDSSPRDGRYAGKYEEYYDDAETGVTSTMHLPPDVVRSLHSVLLEYRTFPYASTLCAALLPLFFLWDEPASLSVPVVLVTAALAARLYFARRSCDVLHWESAWRKLDQFAKAAAASGGTAGAALEAMEVLAYFHSVGGHDRSAGLFRSYGSEALVRIARDPALKPKVLRELKGREKRRGACLALTAITALLALAMWGSWPLFALAVLSARDAARGWREMREVDQVASDLYELATNDADIAGGRKARLAAECGDGIGNICASAGKSWVISPLFEKLRERPGVGGGRERQSKVRADGPYSPGAMSIRSTRRRRKQGSKGRVGVV